MVDPFILKTGWGFLCGLLLLMLPRLCTLVSARLFSHQLTNKWLITLLICRCCTPCTTDRGISTLSHRSQHHCWLLSILLMFDWHDFHALSGDFERELQAQYFSPSKGEDSTSPALTSHQSHDEETQSSVPMLLATGTTTVPLVIQCQLRRTATVLPHKARYDVAASSSLSVVKLQRRFSAPTLLPTVTHPVVLSALQCFIGRFALIIIDKDCFSAVCLPHCDLPGYPTRANTCLAK